MAVQERCVHILIEDYPTSIDLFLNLLFIIEITIIEISSDLPLVKLSEVYLLRPEVKISKGRLSG